MALGKPDRLVARRRGESLVIELHRLIRAGRGDDPEADRVRDDLAASLQGLSAGDAAELEALSGDLYSLADQEQRLASGQTRSSRAWLEQLRSAVDERRWGDAIGMLRSNRNVFAASHTAYMRGRAYFESGWAAAGVEFMDYAAGLEPTHSNYRALELAYRAEGEGLEAVVPRALSELGNEHADPSVVIFAASIICRAALRRPEPGDLAEGLTLAVRRLPLAVQEDGEPIDVASLGYVIQGFCLLMLQRVPAALGAFRAAADMSPQRRLSLESIIAPLERALATGRDVGVQECVRQFEGLDELGHGAVAALQDAA